MSTWAFGSRARYPSAVKTWLAANGYSGTTIEEPTGISPRNVITPADLTAMGKLAMADPAVASIVGSSTVTVPGVRQVSNDNISLGSDGINHINRINRMNGMSGVKTGTLDTAGWCLLFSATVNVGMTKPITIIRATLGGRQP